MAKAFLVIDMLNDFTLDSAPLKVAENKKIIPNIQKRIDDARDENSIIIYICDSHLKNDREFKIWPEHCVEGTNGAQVVNELSPKKEDLIIKKTTYDGFYNTPLDSILKNMGISELIITGCVSHICILHTASSAILRGYNVSIPLDSIASLDEKSRDCAIDQFKNVLNIKLI